MEGRILMYGPPGRDALLAQKVFESVQIPVTHCAGEADLARQLQLGAGALLVGEEMLTPSSHAVLLAYLEAQQAWSDLPILLLTRTGADSLDAQRAVEKLGNVTVLERPVRTMALISAGRSALRARSRQYEMRALDQRKDEFLATLAHELRNPLSPIRNAMSILQRLHPSPQVGKLVGIVERQVSHLKRLVDDLLDIARITNGKLELQRSVTTVDKVVTHAVEIAQEGITAKAHRLTVKRPAKPVELHADHVRVVQALANLLVNAAKFTPPSGDIVLSVRVDGAAVVFSVRDSGKGLEPEFLQRIFDMFSQSRTVGEPTSGLGLGLHLARAFARLHGGELAASSEGPGKGSEFVLRLPVVVHLDAPGQAQALPSGAVLQRSVLVVDDNIDAASTLSALLALRGAVVDVAHDGAQALACVKALRPDVVVMDIGMPVMNGYDAARAIRSELPGRTPTLVALTGWGQYADKARAREAGFDFHFVKPLDVEELVDCLSHPPPGVQDGS
ncbi:MAG TPA: ATP-binding protein [Ramlibacter sp.]|nr:ATP-binding protein [Ramlibacter sp.]